MTAAPIVTRRLVLGAAASLVAAPVLAVGRPVVTLLGDSITAGFGLAAAEALPARLQVSLARLGRPAVVRGAGVSGDTTASGLARLDFSVQSDTALCVVALGGNDLLRGLDPVDTRRNLTHIVRRLKARRIAVLLAGLTAPPVIGRSYALEFDAVFPAVARAERVRLYPDLLAGVGGVRELNQSDGIHPSARGAAIIASRLAPVVAAELSGRA